MAVHRELQYASPDDLYLDPKNPRLGRHNTGDELTQAEILKLMQDWTLDELAVSFLESGFWPQEALLVVEENIAGEKKLVVVEGNRRLAAIRYLLEAKAGNVPSRRWVDIAKSGSPEQYEALKSIPYLRADDRVDVESYLGFRHVTGIKPWKPAEKAEYITYLIEKRGLSYREVMRKIGSKTPTVRQHYITFRLLLQMENAEDQIAIDKVEDKFSVLYLSLKVPGVKAYLGVNLEAEPNEAKKPVPSERSGNLVNFALWLFGDEKTPPLVSDSRLVDRFGKILLSPEALDYLTRAEEPTFETAYRKTGGDVDDLVSIIERADDSVQEALTGAHRYRDEPKMQRAMQKFAADAMQLIRVFPELETSLLRKNDASIA
jgi:hypothetical protein